MAIIRCKNGHFYDKNRSEECPYCETFSSNATTLGDFMESAVNRGKTMMLLPEDEMTHTDTHSLETVSFADRQKDHVVGFEMDDDNKTVAMWGVSNDRKLITGWLVCVKGEEKGQDYPLYAGFNKIGRGVTNDVCIAEDPMISRDSNCSIVYENKKNQFFIIPENGKTIFVDNDLLDRPKKLVGKEKISLGNTTLVFIPFCQEGLAWEE